MKQIDHINKCVVCGRDKQDGECPFEYDHSASTYEDALLEADIDAENEMTLALFEWKAAKTAWKQAVKRRKDAECTLVQAVVAYYNTKELTNG